MPRDISSAFGPFQLLRLVAARRCGKVALARGVLTVAAALFAFGPLTAPLAAAAVWNWRRRRYFTAALFGLGIACVWALAYGATPALLVLDARTMVGR
jgi:hypothetical protein